MTMPHGMCGDCVEIIAALTEERDTQMAIGLRKDAVVAELRDRLAAAEMVIEAAKEIRAKYPGGKMLWFSEFSAFEEALAAVGKKEGT